MSTRRSAEMSVDVAVIGGGPGGIAAAARAAECGRRVLLLDENPALGGQIWRHRRGQAPPVDATDALARFGRTRAHVAAGASVVDVHADPGGRLRLTAEQAGRPLSVDSDALILATGARELFLPLPGWTLPGVVGVGGTQALCKSGVTFAGHRVVIAGSGPLLLPVAALLSQSGADVVLVAEQAGAAAVARFVAALWRAPSTLVRAAALRRDFIRAPYRTGTWVSAAHGVDRLEAVTVTDGRREQTIRCDMLCTGHGLVPSTELARLAGCRVDDGAVVVDDRQETTVARIYCVGEATGIGGVDLSLVEGEIAGAAAAGAPVAPSLRARRQALRATAAVMRRAFAPRSELRALVSPDTIVCRCEDVTYRDVCTASSARQAKLYTRAGMGACQGRVCGAALQFLRGWPADSVRLPTSPALLATLLANPGALPDQPSHQESHA